MDENDRNESRDSRVAATSCHPSAALVQDLIRNGIIPGELDPPSSYSKMIAKRLASEVSLMSLPAELRLQVFENVEESNSTISVDIAQNCIHRLEPNGRPTLAALSRTCKQIHAEVADRLYRYRRFNVDIIGSDSLLKLFRLNFHEDLGFLNRMESVHLAVTVNTGTSQFGRVFEMLYRALVVFTRSASLKQFTFQVRDVYHVATRHNYVNARLASLRTDVGWGAVVTGKSEKEAELDFAWATLAFFKNGFR